jgi:hypothetical protein
MKPEVKDFIDKLCLESKLKGFTDGSVYFKKLGDDKRANYLQGYADAIEDMMIEISLLNKPE